LVFLGSAILVSGDGCCSITGSAWESDFTCLGFLLAVTRTAFVAAGTALAFFFTFLGFLLILVRVLFDVVFFEVLLLLGFFFTAVFLLRLRRVGPAFVFLRLAVVVLLRRRLAVGFLAAVLRRRRRTGLVPAVAFFLLLVDLLRVVVVDFAALRRLRRFGAAAFLTAIKFSLRIYNLPELAYSKKPNTSIPKIILHGNHFSFLTTLPYIFFLLMIYRSYFQLMPYSATNSLVTR
jgi:hypothetical protein